MNRRTLTALAMASLMGFHAFADADISGTVFSRSSSEPLDFVSVVLVDAATGNTLPITTMSGADGSFILAGVPSGNYVVRVSSVGTVAQERPVEVAENAIELGRILLADDAELLKEVVVKGQRGQMSVNARRRVFNVSSNITAAGASAEELLASVPSVDVSADGDISLRGNDDVLVWINGKAMGMNADNRSQFLRQIPAENIESIEVMTNPSSKHSTEGTAGIINIRLKEDHRHGYFGSAEVTGDTRGNVNANANINYNEGHFESFAALGLKAARTPGGSESRRSYDDGAYLNSDGRSTRHDNSVFLRLGTNYKPDDKNTFYVSAVGTLGHKWGRVNTIHRANLPGIWATSANTTRESGDTRGANVLLGYKHSFAEGHSLEMNVSYNIWQGPNDSRSQETETMPDGTSADIYHSQHQDVKISNWEAAVDYTKQLASWIRLEAGYKGNYNHENSPASYFSGNAAGEYIPLDNLYNRFKYDTDISALYLSFSGSWKQLSYSAGLRGEAWQISTRSLAYGQTDADVAPFRRNSFALFPSASLGWNFKENSELKLTYSRRIRRPFGPQLNTFENIADPSEVHLGNPEILPEYSNAAELTYVHNWAAHTLSVSGYMRSNTDMISHVSFLAPMASNPDVNTMYYGHANVGNMLDAGMEIISRNTLWNRLTLTTTVNLYNSHLKAWSTDYPLHGGMYPIEGRRQNRFVWDFRLMASVRLPWEMTFQATGRYNSRRITAQGTLEADWDVEAGLRKNFGAWGVSIMCKDIFNSKKSHNILYGNGYMQDISKWSGGRNLRLAVSYTFGKTHNHKHGPHNEIDTGGYGDSGHEGHHH